MSGNSRNRTRTQPPPSGGASASSANIGEGLSSDLGDRATDDAGASDDAEEEATADPEEVTESISGSIAVDQTRTASGSSADADRRMASEDSPSIPSIINPSLIPLNPLSSTTVATPVGVVRSPTTINSDPIAQANVFLKKHNIRDKIILAWTILRQQPEINFSASDIAELHLTQSELYKAVEMMLSAAMINHTDLIAKANKFLRNCNIQDMIIFASKILIIFIRSWSALCINCISNKTYFTNCYFVFVKRRQ
jgi:hypothetical protein